MDCSRRHQRRHIFRRVNRMGKPWGAAIMPTAIWHVLQNELESRTPARFGSGSVDSVVGQLGLWGRLATGWQPARRLAIGANLPGLVNRAQEYHPAQLGKLTQYPEFENVARAIASHYKPAISCLHESVRSVPMAGAGHVDPQIFERLR